MRTNRFSLTGLLFFLLLGLNAQISSGTIDYLVTRTFPMWEGASLEMKKRIKEAQERGDFDQTGRVSFTTDAFAYSPLPKKEPEGGGGRGRGRWMRQSENPDIFYTNLKDSTVTDRREIMDRSFIMQDSWKMPAWESPENQQPSMAYTLPSELAFAYTPEGDTLTAYFSRAIPLGIGPQGYGGLPGAIVYLKVENDGRRTEYTMQTMQPNPADLTVTKPEDGDVVDREEFEKILKKRQDARERQRRGWRRGRGGE